jgi:outer membrane lipoprotein carrier protein
MSPVSRWVKCGAVVLFGALMTSAGAVSAAAPGGVSQLRQFVNGARVAQGEFEQTVFAASGRKPQRASGTFLFSRPGKFRWSYDKPYPQLLVSDGDKLWSWDKDLNQVTVKRLGDELGSTPVAILAGDGALDRDFTLIEAGAGEGLDWVQAKPKSAESTFETIRLGMQGGQLKRMELRDNFGQTTLIVFTFSSAVSTPDASQFRFVPPPGADVIGE